MRLRVEHLARFKQDSISDAPDIFGGSYTGMDSGGRLLFGGFRVWGYELGFRV